jgi:putative GTP pyrophosphokinase
MTIREDYKGRFDASLQRLAVGIENLIRDYLRDLPRIDRISARAKSIDRFVAKSEKVESGRAKYLDLSTKFKTRSGRGLSRSIYPML